MYRLIALDIDGTLIDPEGRVSPANRAAIADARAAGTAVVLCTGRSWQESEELAEEAGCGRKLVCQGGAALADLDERRNTRIWEIPKEAARALTERLEREPLGLMLFAGERVLVNPPAEEIFSSYPCDGYHRVKEVVEHPADYLRTHDLPLSLSLIHISREGRLGGLTGSQEPRRFKQMKTWMKRAAAPAMTSARAEAAARFIHVFICLNLLGSCEPVKPPNRPSRDKTAPGRYGRAPPYDSLC